MIEERVNIERKFTCDLCIQPIDGSEAGRAIVVDVNNEGIESERVASLHVHDGRCLMNVTRIVDLLFSPGGLPRRWKAQPLPDDHHDETRHVR